MISDQQFSTTFFLLITENAMDYMPFCLSENMIPEKSLISKDDQTFKKGIKSGCIKKSLTRIKIKKETF